MNNKFPNQKNRRTQPGMGVSICLSIALFFSLGTIAFAQEPASRERPLRIVASFLPMMAHTLAIAGDRAEVVQLLAKDSGPHDFQLTPADVRKLADADLLIINGAGVESWLDQLIRTAGNRELTVVNASSGIELREGGQLLELPVDAAEPEEHVHDEHCEHDHDHASHEGHTHGPHCRHEGENPHLWLDPVFALQQARTILDALVDADPANAEYFRANAERYFAALRELDANFKKTISSLPNKKLVTFHDAFPYLADRYGLDYVGYIEQMPEKDPSPRQLAAIVNLIKENKIGVVFAERGYSTILFERIAGQTGAKVSELDTLEIGEGTADSYIERMNQNLEALAAAFGS